MNEPATVDERKVVTEIAMAMVDFAKEMHDLASEKGQTDESATEAATMAKDHAHNLFHTIFDPIIEAQ